MLDEKEELLIVLDDAFNSLLSSCLPSHKQHADSHLGFDVLDFTGMRTTIEDAADLFLA